MTNAPPKEIHEGESALVRLLDDMASESLDLNEADTRHRFIDRLVHECLGWDRAAVRLERNYDGEYSDYELGQPPQAVIEAKRAGLTFLLPDEGPGGITRSLRSLSKTSPSFRKAAIQAQEYCAKRGIQTAAIANSTQIVVFLAVRTDGIPPLEGKCLVFDGPTGIKEHFVTLWQAVSPFGTEQRTLFEELRSSISTSLPQKLCTYITNYPSFRYPSDDQQSLKTLSDLLIEDAPNTAAIRKQFLEQCYCESGALAQEALLGKRILAARYASMFSPTAVGPSLQPINGKNGDRVALTPEVVAEALGRRPIVIIGDVGVGKTSFIRHLVYVGAEAEMADAIFLYLDLGDRASLGQDIREFFLREIERQLFENFSVDLYEDSFVRGVYHGDLLRFGRGIYGRLKESAPDQYLVKEIEHLDKLTANKIIHLQICIAHIAKGRKKQIVVCIDNADQRDSFTQQEAFLSAQEFASSWQALVLVSMRPRTYFASKVSGPMSAYPQRLLTISPPRIDLVLRKRLEFSLDLAEGRVPIERLEGVSLRLDSVALFIKALINSLRRNKDLSELLSNITGGNIREAMDFIKGFIGSANVDSRKIIEIMRADGEYIIPLHEFSKQALLGEYAHYHSGSSMALNLFDTRYPLRTEHFLCPIIVSFLTSDGPTKTLEGFVPTSQILLELQGQGYVADQIEHALRRLTNKKLIETTERITFDEGLQGLVGDMPLAFRGTTVGAYHVQRWAPTFPYLDAMAIDSPILDEAVRKTLLAKVGSFELEDRFNRASAFRHYLKESWLDLAAKPVYFDWSNLCNLGQPTFDSVHRVLQKQHRER